MNPHYQFLVAVRPLKLIRCAYTLRISFPETYSVINLHSLHALSRLLRLKKHYRDIMNTLVVLTYPHLIRWITDAFVLFSHQLLLQFACGWFKIWSWCYRMNRHWSQRLTTNILPSLMTCHVTISICVMIRWLSCDHVHLLFQHIPPPTNHLLFLCHSWDGVLPRQSLWRLLSVSQ